MKESRLIGEKVIVRAARAGVYFGTLLDRQGDTVVLERARKLNFWSGAGAVEGLAAGGVLNPDACTFSRWVKFIELGQVVQVLKATEDSIKIIEELPEWSENKEDRANGIPAGEHEIFIIDSLPTILTSVKGNLAKGYILRRDMTCTPTYVAKGEDYFAHGTTPRDAYANLEEKILANMDIEEKIEKFKEAFPVTKTTLPKKHSVETFRTWFKNLTGACAQGISTFMEDRGIKEDGKFTILEFFDTIEDAYAWNSLRDLAEEYRELD